MIAFDQNVPPGMVRAFQALANEHKFKRLVQAKVVSAADYAPSLEEIKEAGKSDVNWIVPYAKAGGQVIVSGDGMMRQRPHERLALVQANMVVFFFDRSWNNEAFWAKCSLLLRWWPMMIEAAKAAPTPSFWVVPATWSARSEIRQVPHHDLRLERILRQKARAPEVRRARRRRNLENPNQAALDLEGKNDNQPAQIPKSVKV